MPVAELPIAQSNFTGTEKPQWHDYARCIHCGLCLNHCPTYRLWGLEADSPRGRIRQMLLVDHGRLELGDGFVRHMDQCLDCRACETACPSGVEYGRLVEAARAQIEQNYRRPLLSRTLRRIFFRKLLPHPKRIAQAARVVRFYQRSGLQRLARASGFLRLLGLHQRERLLPQIDDDFFFTRMGHTFPALAGTRRARVALFAGCLAQVTCTRLNEATIRVLQANGCEVIVPAGQLCCGALAVHAGVRDVARGLARTNVKVFLRDSFDAIITNAAGCGSTLKQYAHLFPTTAADAGEQGCDPDISRSTPSESSVPEWQRAAEFAGKVRDVTEFLAELGLVAPLHELNLRVTVQDSCHLIHGQRIKDAPRKLIGAVPGVELVEMCLADHCCGSAGIYNVTQTKASLEILREKMECVQQTGADAIVTANPGCILQLRAGAELYGSPWPASGGRKLEVLHVVELLDRALAGT